MTRTNIAETVFRRTIPGTTTVEPIDLAACFASMTRATAVDIEVVTSFYIKPTEAARIDRGTAEYAIYTETIHLDVNSITRDAHQSGFIITGDFTDSDEDSTRQWRFDLHQEDRPGAVATYTRTPLGDGHDD